MIYRVVRQPGDPPRYQVFVHNTGAGSEYHPSQGLPDGTKVKAQDVLGFDDVSQRAFGTPEAPGVWLQALLEPRTLEGADPNVTYTSEDVYTRLFPPPGGRQTGPEGRDGRYFTRQRAGTCVWKAQMSVLRHALPYPEYRRVKLEIRLAALDAFLEHYRSLATPQRRDHDILACAIELIARSATKMVDAGHLEAKALPRLERILSDARGVLAAWHPARPPAVEGPHDWRPATAARRPPKAAVLPPGPPVPDGKPRRVVALPPPAEVPPPLPAAMSGPALDAWLDASLAFADRSLRAGHPREITAYLERAFLDLEPPPYAAPTAGWSELPPLPTLDKLESLLRYYVSAALRSSRDDGRAAVTAVSIAWTADRVAQGCPILGLDTWGFDWKELLCRGLEGPVPSLDARSTNRLVDLLGVIPRRRKIDLWKSNAHFVAPPNAYRYFQISNVSSEGIYLERFLGQPEIAAKLGIGPGDSALDKKVKLTADLGDKGLLSGDARGYGVLKHLYLLVGYLLVRAAPGGFAADQQPTPLRLSVLMTDGAWVYFAATNTTVGFAPYIEESDREAAQKLRIGDPALRDVIFAKADWAEGAARTENEALIAARKLSHTASGATALYRIGARQAHPTALAANAAVAHALGHIAELTQPDRQLELELALRMRSPGLELDDYLRAGPELSMNLAALLERGVALNARVSGSVQTALFFARLSRELGEHFRRCGIEQPLPDSRAVCRALWSRSTLTPEERAAVGAEHLATAPRDGQVAAAELCALLHAAAWFQLCLPPEPLLPAAHRREAEAALARSRGAVARGLANPEVRASVGAMLDEVLASLGVRSPTTEWSGQYPTLSRGEWAFDVPSGRLFAHGVQVSIGLPAAVVESAAYRAVFGAERVAARREGTMYVIGEDAVRIDPGGEDGDVAIHRRVELDGQRRWFQHVDPVSFPALALLLPPGVRAAHRFLRGERSDQLLVTDPKGEPRMLIDRAEGVWTVTRLPATGKGAAQGGEGGTAGATPGGGGRRGEQITANAGPGLQLQHGFTPPAPLARIGTEVLLWRDVHGDTARIEVPALDLEFAVGSDGRARWTEDRHFHVADRAAPIFDQLTLDLTLESTAGARQVLLPWATLEPGAPGFEAMEGGAKSFRCALEGGRLRTADPLENLQLAYFHAADRNYVRAAEYLRRTDGLSLDEPRARGLLFGIATRRRLAGDWTPDALALAARASQRIVEGLAGGPLDGVLEKMGLRGKEAKDQFKVELGRDFAAYLSVRAKVDVRLLLSAREERQVVALSADHDPQVAQRARFLTGRGFHQWKVKGSRRRDPPDVYDFTLLREIREPPPRRWPSWRPTPVDWRDLPILQPGSALKDRFQAALAVALGGDPEARAELRERLELMSPAASDEALKVKMYLLTALDRREQATVLRSRKRGEPEPSSDSDERSGFFEEIKKGAIRPGTVAGTRPEPPDWLVGGTVAAPPAPSAPRTRASRPIALAAGSLAQIAARYVIDGGAGDQTIPTIRSRHGSAPVEQALIAEINENVRAAARDRPAPPALCLDADLARLIAELEPIARTDALQTEARALEALARAVPDDPVARARLELEVGSKQRAPIDLHLMEMLLAQGNLGALTRWNPALTPGTLDHLHQWLLEHLVARSRAQQAQRALTLAKRVREGGVHPAAAAALRGDLAVALASERCYDPAACPDLLVLECRADLLLRRRQVETLARLATRDDGSVPEVIAQLNMGEGKTKILGPILALEKANGENLAVLLMPPALVEVNHRDLVETTDRVFGQLGHRFTFRAGDHANIDHLKFLEARLEAARAAREYVVTTRSSLAALALQHQQLLEEVAARPDGITSRAKHQLDLMGRMLLLFREHGIGLIDEADQALDVRKQVNFTAGAPRSVDAGRRALVLEIYRALIEDPEVASVVRLSENMQAAMPRDALRGLLPRVARRVLSRHPDLSGLAEGADRRALEAYVLGETAQLPATVAAAIGLSTQNGGWSSLRSPTLIGAGASHPEAPPVPEAANLLALLRRELTELLPLTLARSGGEHYGRSATPSIRQATPYDRSQPIERSEFGDPYEAINYTIQTYLHGREPKAAELSAILAVLVRQIRTEAIQEGVDPDDTPAQAVYRTLVQGTRAAGQRIERLVESPEDAAALAEAVRREPDRLLFYLQALVLPQIEVFPRQLRSDTDDLVASLRAVQGFTGTPWNHATYPGRLELELSPETDATTLGALLDPARVRVSVVAAPTVEALLEPAFGDAGRGRLPRALIDAGALFKGRSNGDVAGALREFFRTRPGAGVKGVLHLDEVSGELAVLRLDRAEPVLLGGTDAAALERAGLRRAEMFTYYDQARTVGLDVPQDPRALGVLTIGDRTFLRDAQQGLLRLRQIENQQQCVVAVPQELARNLTAEPNALTMEDVIQHCVRNQAEALGLDKVRKVQQAMLAEARDLVRAVCLRAPAKEAAEIYAACRAIMAINLGDEPYRQQSGAVLAEPRAVLAAQATARGQLIAEVVKGLPAHAAALGTALGSVAHRLTDGALVREAVARVGALPAQVRHGAGETREALVEREVEREVTQEIEQVREAYVARRGAMPDSLRITNIYRSDWLDQGPGKEGRPHRLLELPGGELFDDCIHVTHDLLVSAQGEDLVAFNAYQKPACFVLVYQRRNTSRLGAVLLSHGEAEAVDTQLRERDPRGGDLNLTLLDENGLVLRAGQKPIPREVLESTEVDRLLMQAKILSKPVTGALLLSERQREQLRRWLAEGSKVEQARKHALVAHERL